MGNDAETALFAEPATQLMPPSQALTSGFDLDDVTGHVEPGEGRRGTASRLAEGESRQGFKIGPLRLMIRYEDGSELSELSNIHRLPNAPEWFCGMANFHGKLTPVFDLARYIGVESAPEAKRMLLVLAAGADATGVLIDGLPERLRWSSKDYTGDASAAPASLAPHLRGSVHIGEQQWFDLDTQSLLGAIEQSLGEPQ